MNIDNITSDGIALSNNGKEMLIKVYEQEIKRLKEEYMILQNASDKVEEKLQQRIDKAIEYITTEQLYTNYQWGEEFYSQLLKDLLNILKGSDKEC